MEKFTIPATNGPRLKFTGKLLASTEWETDRHDPIRVRLEVYETEGGALIAVRTSEPVERQGFMQVDALVVEPVMKIDDCGVIEVTDCLRGGPSTRFPQTASVIDHQAMHFAVMDGFSWHDRARSMNSKQLKWDLTRRVA